MPYVCNLNPAERQNTKLLLAHKTSSKNEEAKEANSPNEYHTALELLLRSGSKLLASDTDFWGLKEFGWMQDFQKIRLEEPLQKPKCISL